MSLRLYNPIENLHFDEKDCFLTGTELSASDESITVFPEWVLNRYNMGDSKFTMMDNVTSFLHKDFKLPCSEIVRNAFSVLDNEVQTAFDGGYDAVRSLNEQRLFLWMGRMVYGVLYHDLLIERENCRKRKSEFKISPILKKRFALFHLMLQSLISPIRFGGIKPWNMTIVRLKYSKDIFNYRDDSVNLIFSVGVNGFGIIGMLQDNGMVKQNEKDILDKIGSTMLHPVQFEELKARFVYSRYLLQYRPEYHIKQFDESIVIESESVTVKDVIPLFAKWDDKMFADVLSEYWKPWGLQKKDIYTAPNAPISFLKDEYSNQFIIPESIKLPF